jgi:hypothetical protein
VPGLAFAETLKEIDCCCHPNLIMDGDTYISFEEYGIIVNAYLEGYIVSIK